MIEMEFPWAVFFTLFGTISGSIIAAVVQYKNNKLNHQFELEKAQKLQMLEMSFKEFEMKNKLNEKLVEEGEEPDSLPWEFHLMIHMKLMQFIKENDLEDENLDQKLINFLGDIKHFQLTYKHFSK
jgi:Na+-translocating ferredoxin:NAD+ oxidoreductase RnfG subunit